MNTDAIKALLERVNKAEQDTDLGIEINEALGVASYITAEGDPTTSTDAALWLTKQVYPDVIWFLEDGGDSDHGCTLVFGEGDRINGDWIVGQPCWAILHALLNAVIQKQIEAAA